MRALVASGLAASVASLLALACAGAGARAAPPEPPPPAPVDGARVILNGTARQPNASFNIGGNAIVGGELQVFGGAALIGNAVLRFDDARVGPPGEGWRLRTFGDFSGLGVDKRGQWYASEARHVFYGEDGGELRETASIDGVGNLFASGSVRAPNVAENATSLVVGADKNAVFVVPKLGVGGFNHLSQPGDSGIVFGAPDSGALVIVPWSSRAGGAGIRVTNGTVTVSGDFEVKNGTKRFVEPHPDDPDREIVFVALEGPEAGTYCRGTARIAGARTRVALPDSFAAVTSDAGLTAQVTALGRGRGLFVESRTRRELVVGCDEGAACPKSFDWIVNGVRRGYEALQAIRARR